MTARLSDCAFLTVSVISGRQRVWMATIDYDSKKQQWCRIALPVIGRSIGRRSRCKRVDFTFSTARIQEICERRTAAVAELGEAVALDLERRLADIDACENALDFRDLCASDLVELTVHRWILHLRGGYLMELVAGHARPRLTGAGATDWGKVTRLRVEVIGEGND